MYNYFENMSQEFRLKNIDKAGNYLLKEIKQNALMSRKHKQLYWILALTITGCIAISAFASLTGIPMSYFLWK